MIQNDQATAKQLKLDQKRELKEEKRQAKLVRKEERLTRREERRARKQQRREMRSVIRSSCRVDRPAAVELLKQIVAGLEAGSITVDQKGESLTIHPEDSISFSIRARENHKNQSLRVRLQWPRTETTEPEVLISTPGESKPEN